MPTRKRPKRPDPAPRKRQGKSLNVWINPALREALDLAVERSRPRSNVRAVVEVAIEEYLKGLGLWPPGQADAPEED